MTTKKAMSTEAIDTAMELTQKTANLTLKSTVQAVEVTEHYVQGIYKAGYDANLDALKVVKGYWDAAAEIRHDWLKLFASTGEAFINSATKMELPLQKEVFEFGKSVLTNVEKSVENLTSHAKTATAGK
ncbi:MAG: hypothetical protein JSS81_06780 [Acidobacteria bacterium]|nr:hypothetical protein [Acidobacteriota bacterium]